MNSPSSPLHLSFPVAVNVVPNVDKREMFSQEVQVSVSVWHQSSCHHSQLFVMQRTQATLAATHSIVKEMRGKGQLLLENDTQSIPGPPLTPDRKDESANEICAA